MSEQIEKQNKRLYMVTNKETKEVAIVEASTPAGAIAAKARAVYEAKPATARDVQAWYDTRDARNYTNAKVPA